MFTRYRKIQIALFVFIFVAGFFSGAVTHAAKKYEGVKLVVSSIPKKAAAGFDPSVKSLNYLANMMAKAEAVESQFHDTLMLGEKNEITELSTANFFCVIRKKVITPPLSACILPGIIRESRCIFNSLHKINFRPPHFNIHRKFCVGRLTDRL